MGAPKALAEGFLDAIEAIPLKNGGFFFRYIDRQVDGGSQHDRLGVFYNAAGNEVGRQVFDPTATFTSTGIAEAAVLKNGNVAVAYGAQSGGTVTQVFTPTGDEVSSLRTVTEESRSLTAIAALPDGGYVVSYGGVSPVKAIFLQRFNATGRPVGGEVTFETGAGGATSVSIAEPELAVTEDGLIALAWSGQSIGGTTDADIYLALFSPGGEPVFGPAIVNSVRQDRQVSPQFDVLPDGRLFLSFLEKAFKPFVYQDAIQGVYVETPDSFWEGTAADNSKSGTAGDDVLLGLNGNDRLNGLAGGDYIKGGLGADTIFGGDGNDILKGDAGNDYLEGEAGRDLLRGGAGSDILRGGDDDDRVYGEDGNDFIYSDGGNDKEYGGAGDDTFYDSDGNDSMWGETGSDRFVFQDRVFGQDRIKDFEFGIDTLDMGFTARALVFAGQGPIRVVEVTAGVRFVVDADNWVLVEGARLSDFEVGDYRITDPFG